MEVYIEAIETTFWFDVAKQKYFFKRCHQYRKQIFCQLKLKYKAPNIKKLNLFPSSSVIYPYRP
jgi:hypothetical protein